jgi:hypothetical protein
MPTYRNIKSHWINFAVKLKSYNLAPNALIEVDELLDHIEGLKRTDEDPFYNPLYERHIFTGIKNQSYEFPVDTLNVQMVRVSALPGSVDLYINSLLNVPPVRVNNHFIFDVRSYKRIEKIILNCLQKSEIELYMFRTGESMI